MAGTTCSARNLSEKQYARHTVIHEVPEDLAAAMAAEPAAEKFYATLSYSAQRRYVEPLAEAKAPETRSRRIAKVVADLKAGKK